jgi:hypothetical protein
MITALLILTALILGIFIGKYQPFQFFQPNIGEALVANEIHASFHLPHVLINNVTLRTGSGTTQIDHILVAMTGIFIIETKHYTGWIFGNPNEAQWTQVIFKKKSRFQNPIRQNFAHQKALLELLKLDAKVLFPLVVFTSDAEFKTDLGPTVLRLSKLAGYLTGERPILFDEATLTRLVGMIEMHRLRKSLDTDEYHINHLRKRFTSDPSAASFAPITNGRPTQPLGTTSTAKVSKPATPPKNSHTDSRYMPRE